MHTFELSWPEFLVNLVRFDKYCRENAQEYVGYISSETNLKVHLSYNYQADIILISNYWSAMTETGEATPTSEEQLLFIRTKIDSAMDFGRDCIAEFAAENVALGITQAGMTGTVSDIFEKIVQALQTGSLYYAIDLAKAIPTEDKDATFVTDIRLLAFVNKLETYLGIPLSTSL